MPKKKFEDWTASDKSLVSGFSIGIVVGLLLSLIGWCMVSAAVYGAITSITP